MPDVKKDFAAELRGIRLGSMGQLADAKSNGLAIGTIRMADVVSQAA